MLLEHLQVAPDIRKASSVNIVSEALLFLSFFAALSKNKLMADKKVVVNCAKKLLLEKANKGDSIIIINGIPDKFYVTLSGEINVYKPRDRSSIDIEVSLLNKLRSKIEGLKKSTDLKKNYEFIIPEIEDLVKLSTNLSEEEIIQSQNWKLSKILNITISRR